MRHKKCLQTHHHVSPPTFGVDILLLLYSYIYKGIRSFVLVPWMQRQCPVITFRCKSALSGESTSPHLSKGWSGGAMVLGKLPVPVRPTILITVEQGHTALAVGASGGCLDIFTLIYPFFPLFPSLWETVRYRLKYCLKGPLNPKPTNPINLH